MSPRISVHIVVLLSTETYLDNMHNFSLPNFTFYFTKYPNEDASGRKSIPIKNRAWITFLNY